MVDGLTEAAKDADFTPRVDCRAEHDFLEQVNGKMLGAGEGEQKTAGCYMPQRVEIEKLVRAGGRVDVASFVCQRGGVEDDNVE